MLKMQMTKSGFRHIFYDLNILNLQLLYYLDSLQTSGPRHKICKHIK